MMFVNREDTSPIWQQLLNQAIYNITQGIWTPGELLLLPVNSPSSLESPAPRCSSSMRNC